ncbi:MAG: ribulose-phosphate 3-epimerase [Bacteroidota bacterium]
MTDLLVAPSILASDFGKLDKEIQMLNESEADWVHCDIMDGRFVPNISFGIPVLKAVKKVSKKPLDVHLMIVEPEKYITAFRDAGADILTVHVEAVSHLDRTVHAIKEAGMKVGLALNPATSVHSIQYVLSEIDLVLLMTVNPGFGGQSFIPYVNNKIKMVREWADRYNPALRIEVDGGINKETSVEVVKAGADTLVAGSYVFKADNPFEPISYLKGLSRLV